MRSILGVVLGYVVMAMFITVAMFVGFGVIGPTAAVDPATLEVTAAWLWVNLPMSLAGAIAGGLTAAVVAGKRGAAHVLAGIVVTLGLGWAVAAPSIEAAFAEELEAQRAAILETPVAEMGFSELAQIGEQPAWYAYVVPLVGGFGIVVGAALAPRRSPRVAAPVAGLD